MAFASTIEMGGSGAQGRGGGSWVSGTPVTSFLSWLLPTFSANLILGSEKMDQKSDSEKQGADDVQSYLGTKGPPGKGPGSGGRCAGGAGHGIRKHWLLMCPGVGWEVRVRSLEGGVYVMIRVTGQEIPAFLILPLSSLTKEEGFTRV